MIKAVAMKPEYYPKQSTDWSAWFDVFSAARVIVQPWEAVLIPLWVKLMMDPGECCLVMSRSSMPLKKKCMIPNGVWLIDSDYRGEINIEVYNFSNEPVIFEQWEKCWQLVFVKYFQSIATFPIENYDNWDEIYKSERWTWWFGSTWN